MGCQNDRLPVAMKHFLQTFLVISALVWTFFSTSEAAAQPSGFRFGVHGASRPGISRSQGGASMRTLYSTGLGSDGGSGFYQGASAHDKVMRSLDRFSVKMVAKSAEKKSKKNVVRAVAPRTKESAARQSGSRQGAASPRSTKVAFVSDRRIKSRDDVSSERTQGPNWVQAAASKKSKRSRLYSHQRELRTTKRKVNGQAPWWSNK